MLKGSYQQKGNVRTAPACAACGLGVVRRQTRGLRVKEPFWYLYSRSLSPMKQNELRTNYSGVDSVVNSFDPACHLYCVSF